MGHGGSQHTLGVGGIGAVAILPSYIVKGILTTILEWLSFSLEKALAESLAI